jgi:hypothetical protein
MPLLLHHEFFAQDIPRLGKQFLWLRSSFYRSRLDTPGSHWQFKLRNSGEQVGAPNGKSPLRAMTQIFLKRTGAIQTDV